jgi:hypothetical protein
MNYILFVILLSVYSLEQKLCINCKFFRNTRFCDDKYGKCSLFNNSFEEKNDFSLVNGKSIKKIKNDEYHFCILARKYEFMCGKKAKLFETK